MDKEEHRSLSGLSEAEAKEFRNRKSQPRSPLMNFPKFSTRDDSGDIQSKVTLE